jgi:hypothetical protein
MSNVRSRAISQSVAWMQLRAHLPAEMAYRHKDRGGKRSCTAALAVWLIYQNPYRLSGRQGDGDRRTSGNLAVTAIAVTKRKRAAMRNQCDRRVASKFAGGSAAVAQLERNR